MGCVTAPSGTPGAGGGRTAGVSASRSPRSLSTRSEISASTALLRASLAPDDAAGNDAEAADWDEGTGAALTPGRRPNSEEQFGRGRLRLEYRRQFELTRIKRVLEGRPKVAPLEHRRTRVSSRLDPPL